MRPGPSWIWQGMEKVATHWPEFQLMDGEIHDWDREHYVIQCKVHWIRMHWELHSCIVSDVSVYLNAFCECMYICSFLHENNYTNGGNVANLGSWEHFENC